MIVYNKKHNFIEIGQYEMDAQLNNKKLRATIFQEETISPFRKRLTSNKVGVVSYAENEQEVNPALWTDEVEKEFIAYREQAKLLPTYSKLGVLSYAFIALLGILAFVFVKYADFDGSTLGRLSFENEFLDNPSTEGVLILETTRQQKTIPYQKYYVLDIVGDTVVVSNPGGMRDLKDKVGKFDINDKRKPIKISKSHMSDKTFKVFGSSESRPILEIRKKDE